MKILMTAKSFGYGSASKLVTLARDVGADERRFVGSGIALDFAQRNRHAFTSIVACEVEEGAPLLPHLLDCDALVSVRNAESVFWAHRLGVRSVFVDSLLWFWKPQRRLDELVDLAAVFDRLPQEDAWERFRNLPEHDRAVMGHVLADASVAQRFPGVDERVTELCAAGATGVRVCGPILSYDEIEAAAGDDGSDGASAGVPWDVVVNVCGYDNFRLDARTTPAYLRLVERWVTDYAARHTSCRNVLVCGGPYRDGGAIESGRACIRFATLPRAELLRVASQGARYLCSPGLTSVLETVALSRVPRMGPPQHSCHLALIRVLEANGLDQLGLDFCSVLPDEQVPADDLAGTEAIIGQASRVLRDPVAFRAIASRLDGLLELSAFGGERVTSSELHRLRQLLAGPDARDAVGDALFATTHTSEMQE